jgi:hypothetical protein
MVGVSSVGSCSSAFSVYKACSLQLVLRWLALLLPAGLGGEGVEFEFAAAVLGLEGGQGCAAFWCLGAIPEGHHRWFVAAAMEAVLACFPAGEASS